MSKDSKRNKKKNSSSNREQDAEKNLMANEIKVHGAIEIHPSQQSKEEHKAERIQDEPYKTATKNYEFRAVIISALTFIVTTIYMIFTIGIFLQTKRTAKDAEMALDISIQTARLDQRPWVGVRETRIINLKAHEPFKAVIIFFNTGK